jgi:hypothetical protein
MRSKKHTVTIAQPHCDPPYHFPGSCEHTESRPVDRLSGVMEFAIRAPSCEVPWGRPVEMCELS